MILPAMREFKNTSQFRDRHGQMRWRFRKTGLPTHYFESPYGTPEFEDEWLCCMSGQAQAAKAKRKSKPIIPDANEPVVYFVGADHGPVKIGFTRNLTERLDTIQWGYPYRVSVLAIAAGGQAAEARYHKRFFRHRLNREWFERAPEIVAEIEKLRAAMANLSNG